MSKTVKDVIEERGYGDYTINVSEYVRITFDDLCPHTRDFSHVRFT